MKLARRTMQYAALALLVFLPMLSRAGALYQAYGKGAAHVRDLAGPWDAFLFEMFSRTLGRLSNGVGVADQLQGGFWSITLFGMTFSDPLALAGHLAARGQIHWPLAAGVLLAIALAVVAGRFFCGWLCPVNTLLELNGALRAWIERRLLARRLPGSQAPDWARGAILLGTLLFSWAAGFNLYVFVLPYAGLARDGFFLIYGGALGFGVLFVLILAVIELFAAPRLWCRGLCPTGLVLEFFGRWRVLGIRRTPGAECIAGCAACIAACPVGVNAREMTAAECCLMCNECAEVCPAEILALGRPARTAPAPRRPGLGRVLPTAFVLILLAGSAAAHHMQGQPHYGYLENYPQTPTREAVIATPSHEIRLIAYVMEGLKRTHAERPDDVMLYLSITDRRTGKAHTGQVDLTFRPTGGGDAMRRKFKAPLEETVYRMRLTLPAPAYDVEIGIADGLPARLRLELADGGLAGWLWAALAIIALAAALVIALALNRRRRVRADRTAG